MCLFSRLFIIISIIAVVVVGFCSLYSFNVITFRHIFDNNELTKMDSGGK